MHKLKIVTWALSVFLCSPLIGADLPATGMEQLGQPLEGAAKEGARILSNEPGGKASLDLEFDLGPFKEKATPLALLRLKQVEKLPVKRAGEKSTGERCVLSVYAEKEGKSRLVGSLPTKAGGQVSDYDIDVTPAVNETLTLPDGSRKLRLQLRLDGKPVYFETYAVAIGSPVLSVTPLGTWTDDWEKRVEPIGRTPLIYQEAVFPIVETRDGEGEFSLLYPAAKIVSVNLPATGQIFDEGRDWLLRDGKLVVPAGSRLPLLTREEFETVEKKAPDGTSKITHPKVRLEPGTWFHERQIAVTYEAPERGWSLPPSLSTLADLPGLKKKLEAGDAVTVLLFGDSISAGGDSSSLHVVPPYQPNYGKLVANKLARHYGSTVTFINPSRAGATSAYGALQAATQVGGFRPDLAIVAFGMNDRADKRRGEYKANMEKILDTIRADSPETEFIVVTSMLNNPLQPTGLEPIKEIRDQVLSISRPGLAFADVTNTQIELLKHKDYLDLSGNGANHPNDFLHRIYAQKVLEVLLPSEK